MKDNATKSVGFLPGITQPRLVDKLMGRYDAGTGQLRPVVGEAGYSTPWILRKTEHLLAYTGNTCLLLLRQDAPLYEMIARNLTELDQIRSSSAGDARTVAANTNRMSALMLDLSKARATLLAHDEALVYRLETAEKKFRAHVAAYWSGVLARNKAAPLEPCLATSLLSPAFKTYREQWKQVMTKLDTVITGMEANENA